MPARLKVAESSFSPGWITPTTFRAGHWLCISTGSETIVWTRVSLLTNVTKLNALIFTSFGDTPADVMVNVAAPDDGALGLELHAGPARTKRMATASFL